MDLKKCQALKAELESQEEPQCVSVARFFDGNDDLGSIGCNLDDHPGIPAFKKVLEGLLTAPGVEGVWVQISELDPAEDAWPFADTVVVAGKITPAALRKLVKTLQPDEVSDASDYQLSPGLPKTTAPRLVIWWD